MLPLLLQGCAGALVGLSSHPPGYGRSYKLVEARWEKRVPGITAWIESMQKSGALRDTFAVVNGFRLHSFYMEATEPSDRTAIIVHGYLVNQMAVMMLARMYRDEFGYNVWMPALRHLGRSKGDAVQFGWYDRLDVLEWSRIAHERFGDNIQVMHGMSMGAATVMMASGEDTPDYLRGFIEDCGYSSVWDEFQYVSSEKMHVGPKTLARAEEISQKRYGWSYHEASSVNQLAKCTKPMLFIHGGGDTLVPVWMGVNCYNAKSNGYRDMWIAPDSDHSMSYADYPAQYAEKVRTFLKEQVE